ncbi:MAG: dienelactone hydrolase family protein [Gammaproteobacteria bacterium]
MNKNEVSSDWIELASGLRAWLARPKGATSPPGVLLYIEAFGVNGHMQQVADHYARAGYAAIVPDIFHGDVYDYDDLNGAMAAVRKLDDDQVMRESVEALAGLAEAGAADKPAVVGFCMGGRLAFLAGIELSERIAATVCYYGGGIAPGADRDKLGRSAPIGRVDDLAVPVMLHYGARDRSITAEERERVAAALDAAGKRYTLSVYPGAGHGFDCEDRQSYDADASAEAWALTQAFLAMHRDS